MSKYKGLILVFVLLLGLTALSIAKAQEETMADQTDQEEVDQTETEENASSTELIDEEEEQVEEELTAEEEQLIEDAEEISEEELSQEIIEGEVSLVTDEVIVIENENGDLLKVSQNSSFTTASRSRWTRDANNKIVPAKKGEVTLVFPQNSTVETTTGKDLVNYTFSQNAKIYRSGNQIELSDIADDENVEVLLNEDSEVLGVQVVEFETGGAFSSVSVIIGIVILLLLVVLAALSKKKKEVEA